MHEYSIVAYILAYMTQLFQQEKTVMLCSISVVWYYSTSKAE